MAQKFAAALELMNSKLDALGAKVDGKEHGRAKCSTSEFSNGELS